MTKECPRKNLTCHACDKQGHIALVCLGKGNQRQQGQHHQRRGFKKGSASAPASQSASPNLMRDATAAQICSIPSCNIPTPRIQVTVKPGAKGTPFSHAVLPDSGASTSIISADLAHTYGLHIDPKKTMKLQVVNHAQLACSGSVEAEISFGSWSILVSLIVSPAIHGDIILSWHDLVKLNILSPNFPVEINKTETVAEASAPLSAQEVLKLMHDNYPDVLGMFGQGESLKPMKGPPMKITLQDDKPLKPKCILTTIQIPIHMQEEADNIIKQAIEDWILQKTDEPTDWISPAFFVRDPPHGKKKGKLRLVSDFSELNKYIK